MNGSPRFSAAVLDLLAAQWASVGLAIDAATRSSAVVDPEALIVATAAMAEADPRLAETSVDWSVEYSRYVNVARLRRLSRVAPAGDESVGWHGGLVRDAGGPYWSTAAIGGHRSVGRGRVRDLDFAAPSSLLLRLRGLTGINARAEILLRLAAAPATRTLGELAATCAYSKPNVSDAVAFLVDAGAARYVRAANRSDVGLVPAGAPSWIRPRSGKLHAPVWSEILPILVRVAAATGGATSRGPAFGVEGLVAIRNLMIDDRGVLARSDWPVPYPATDDGLAGSFDVWQAQLIDAMSSTLAG